MTQSLTVDDSTKNRPNYLLPLFLALNIPLILIIPREGISFTVVALSISNLVLSTAGYLTYPHAHFYSSAIDKNRIKPIIIQGMSQFSIFCYIIVMNPSYMTKYLVLARIPLIFYQLLFAFSFDYLFQIYRGKIYRPEFYLIPMVFSINLFLWFICQ